MKMVESLSNVVRDVTEQIASLSYNLCSCFAFPCDGEGKCFSKRWFFLCDLIWFGYDVMIPSREYKALWIGWMNDVMLDISTSLIIHLIVYHHCMSLSKLNPFCICVHLMMNHDKFSRFFFNRPKMCTRRREKKLCLTCVIFEWRSKAVFSFQKVHSLPSCWMCVEICDEFHIHSILVFLVDFTYIRNHALL